MSTSFVVFVGKSKGLNDILSLSWPVYVRVDACGNKERMDRSRMDVRVLNKTQCLSLLFAMKCVVHMCIHWAAVRRKRGVCTSDYRKIIDLCPLSYQSPAEYEGDNKHISNIRRKLFGLYDSGAITPAQRAPAIWVATLAARANAVAGVSPGELGGGLRYEHQRSCIWTRTKIIYSHLRVARNRSTLYLDYIMCYLP